MYDVLIVEDDVTIRQELKVLLEKYGYSVAMAEDFGDVVSFVLGRNPHLVLLDINLPQYDGFYVCREIRRRSTIPIIVVTSRDSELDELMSMNLGADDFITKPYSPQILLARIGSVLRRAGKTTSSAVAHYGGIELDSGKSRVSYAGQSAELTKNEMRILQVLIQHAERIVSREELQNELWQSDQFIDDNTLTVNVNRLRSTLAGIGARDLLHTKRGLGYYLKVGEDQA